MYHIDLIVHLQRSRTAELLAQCLSREPSATQLDAGRVPLSLEDRLREAQDLSLIHIFGLMANVPSQVMLPLSQSGQGSRAVRLSSITVISILTSHWTTYRLCLLIQSTLTTLKGSLCRTHRRRYVFQYFLIIKLMSHIQIGF